MPDHPDPSSGKVHKKRNTLCIYININQVAHHHEFHTEHISQFGAAIVAPI